MWRRWQAFRHPPYPEPAETVPPSARTPSGASVRPPSSSGLCHGWRPGAVPAPRTIGVILPPSAREVYENPFYLEMIRGINQFCNAHQYVSTFIVTGRDNDEILAAIRLLVSTGAADAFILLYSRQGDAPSSTIWCRRADVLCSSAKPMPTRTRRSTSTTTTFLPGRRQPNTSSAGGIGASPIWAATTPIFSPPTAGAAIRRRWRWRISPSRGLLRGNADAGQRRRGRARAAQPRGQADRHRRQRRSAGHDARARSVWRTGFPSLKIFPSSRSIIRFWRN